MKGGWGGMRESFLKDNPFWQWMGFRIDEASADQGRAVVTAVMRPEFLQHQYMVHGGVMSSLIDSVGAWAFALKYQESVRTINLSVQYLSPVEAGFSSLEAEAQIVRAGRRIIIAEAAVRSPSGIEVARGQVIYSRAPSQ